MWISFAPDKTFSVHKSNTVARSRNYCYSRKAISITYSGCVFVAFGIQHVICIRRTVICGLSDSTRFFTLIHVRHDLLKKKSYWIHNVFYFLHNFCLQHF